MKVWQRAAAALVERPRSALELAAALGTSASVTNAAVNALDRCGILVRTGAVLSLTTTGREYVADMHPEDSPGVVNPRAVGDVDALVAHAIATQPVSVWELSKSQPAPARTRSRQDPA